MKLFQNSRNFLVILELFQSFYRTCVTICHYRVKIFNQQKLFYSKKCGAITAVTIEKHRKKKAAFGKAKYAFVEFAHKDSVEVCILVAGTCLLTFCCNKNI